MKEPYAVSRQLLQRFRSSIRTCARIFDERLSGDCSCILCLNDMRHSDPLPFLCHECLQHLSKKHFSCSTCGEPFANPVFEACLNCKNAPPAFDQTHCSYLYIPPLDGWIRLAKDHSDQSWIIKLAALMELAPPAEDWLTEVDAVVFVPSSNKRLLSRGYNPGEDLARTLARNLNKPVLSRAIKRTRHSDQRGLKASLRKNNLQHSLTSGQLKLNGKHILLVDDVMTTSATANRVAEILREQGAAKVSNWILARTPGPEFQKGMPYLVRNLIKK